MQISSVKNLIKLRMDVSIKDEQYVISEILNIK